MRRIMSQSDVISMDTEDGDSFLPESMDEEFRCVTDRVAEAG